MEAYGIGPLWDKAEQLLCAADQISVIGYSFPDADIEAKWLFKRAVAKGGRKPTLTIADPSTDAYDRIVAFFGNTVSGATRVPNFEEYVGMDRANS